jgi:hypothetical protein
MMEVLSSLHTHEELEGISAWTQNIKNTVRKIIRSVQKNRCERQCLVVVAIAAHHLHRPSLVNVTLSDAGKVVDCLEERWEL